MTIIRRDGMSNYQRRTAQSIAVGNRSRPVGVAKRGPRPVPYAQHRALPAIPEHERYQGLGRRCASHRSMSMKNGEPCASFAQSSFSK